MKNAKNMKAVIYTRMASGTASERSRAHADQEQECREYAAAHGYSVAATFHDSAGQSEERPGLAALIAYLQEHRGEKHRVVMTDMTRLSRDLTMCVELMTSVVRSGGAIEVTRMPEHQPTKAQFEAFLKWVMTNIKPCFNSKQMN